MKYELSGDLHQRWQQCWKLLDARCGDFDSIARISVATLMYSAHGELTPLMLKCNLRKYSTSILCGLALIQRSE